MMIMEYTQRAHYIDLIRGICVIGIIFIHTCFYSGGSYVPIWMKSISLLLDVPAFFFISGMTMAYIKKDMIINSFFKLSMVFTLLSIILNGIYHELSLISIMQPLFLTWISVPRFFCCVVGSYWFVPVFACTIIVSSVIIKKFENKISFVILVLLIIYCLSYTGVIKIEAYQFLGSKVEMVLFPAICFLFGYWCQNNIVISSDRKKFACCLFLTACIVYLCCYLYKGNNVLNLQANKFPFALPYIAVSFLSMAIFIFFYDLNRKNKWLEHLGKNAIFYYAGQGVSSSVLYIIQPIIHLSWGGKLIIMFVCNLTMAIIFSEVLRLFYEFVAWGFNYKIMKNINRLAKIIFISIFCLVIFFYQLYKKTDLTLSDIQYLFQYDFSKKSNKMEIVGLSHPENWGSWSDGEKVEFVISNLPLRDLQMIFDVHAFLGGKKMVQNVEISANGEIIGHWHFEKGKPTPNTILNIPAEMINSGIVKLTFDFENPLGPKDLGLSEDRRHLGVGFKTMKIIEK